jgi:hypothetical protein
MEDAHELASAAEDGFSDYQRADSAQQQVADHGPGGFALPAIIDAVLSTSAFPFLEQEPPVR